MDAIKLFFAKDIVKIIAGGLYVVCNGLLLTVMPEGALKVTLLTLWNGVITPLAIFLGIASGGVSGLRNDTSNAVTAQLLAKSVLDTKPVSPSATVIVNPLKP
jgi:hypothetical protein